MQEPHSRLSDGSSRRILFLKSRCETIADVAADLAAAGCEVDEHPFGAGLAAALAKRRAPQLLMVEVQEGGDEEAFALVRRIRRRQPRLPIVLVVERSSEAIAIAAIKAGVTDYFPASTPADELAQGVRSLLGFDEDRERPSASARQPGGERLADKIVGGSRPMRQIMETIRMVAPTDTTVLITGETGTGKELVAQLIHQSSPRRQRPFICINCAAVPENLLESEFFGYERGAFTGAVASRPGAFELADGGTLVLDEIGDMAPHAQVKILRAIEGRRIQRLGGRQSIPVDLRVIACTHQDLEQLVAAGRFREDLYYRLHVIRIHVPPLRERKEDLPALFEFCLQRAQRRLGVPDRNFTREAIAYLLRHDWPGNVRELQNFVESVVATHPRPEISLSDLPEFFRRRMERPEALPKGDKERLMAALVATDWNKSRAARRLGCSRMTVYRKLKRYGITSEGAQSTSL